MSRSVTTPIGSSELWLSIMGISPHSCCTISFATSSRLISGVQNAGSGGITYFTFRGMALLVLTGFPIPHDTRGGSHHDNRLGIRHGGRTAPRSRNRPSRAPAVLPGPTLDFAAGPHGPRHALR